MKKNNKFRNNNYNNYNNQVYSLNYKFDSISVAGKCSGTALDLIKRYNEFAKEAQGNGNYVEAEVFRQYAEHYRKIVTEINERKNAMQSTAPRQSREQNENVTTTEQDLDFVEEVVPVVNTEAAPVKREFKVIEIKSETKEPKTENVEGQPEEKQVKRRGRPKIKVETAATV